MSLNQPKESSKVSEAILKVASDLESSWNLSSFSDVVLLNEKPILDVFVTDPIIIDFSLFSLWLDGISVKDAVSMRKIPSSVPFSIRFFRTLIIRDTYDQFRNFSLLERYLQDPKLFLGNQSLLCIEDGIFRDLIERYYELNDDLLRELAGKKLKSKVRGSVDDFSERLRLSFASCRRQFDNLKRTYTFILEKKREGSVAVSISDLLRKSFLMSKELADKYSRFIFLSYNRIETGNKRLRFLGGRDFEYFASILMDHWTSDQLQLDIDSKFKEDIRDCRTYLLSEKTILDTYRVLVINMMKSQSKMEDKKLTNVSSKFNVIVKALLNIGAGISKAKEFEDIFEDLEEKIAETCIKIGLSDKEVNEFFTFLDRTFATLLEKFVFTRHRDRFIKTWSRFLDAIRKCVLHMYEVNVGLSENVNAASNTTTE